MEEQNKNVKKRTLRNEIVSYIRHKISTGEYHAGDRIVETQLAKELNVSQAPVREAILELASMGLVEERPYSGTFVHEITIDEIEDIYNTRAFLNEYAARLATRRASKEDLDEMRELLKKMDASDNINDFVKMDMLFHAKIIEAAGSPALTRMWKSLNLIGWTELSAMATENTLPELIKQHWMIFELIEKGEEHSAGAYMYLHLKNYGDELKRHFHLVKERGSCD